MPRDEIPESDASKEKKIFKMQTQTLIANGFLNTTQFTDSSQPPKKIKTFSVMKTIIEMFYLNSTLNFGIPPVLVFQSEVYYKVDRLLTGIIAKGTTARWNSNKISLSNKRSQTSI